MSVVESAVNGLLGAVVTGAVGAGSVMWTARRKRSRLTDEWQKRADELTKLVTAQYEIRLRQYESTVAYERSQVRERDAEIGRLYRLLSRQGRGEHD